MDAQGQRSPGDSHPRTRARPRVRRGDQRHSRVSQPVPALRAHRKAAERGLGVQGLHIRDLPSSCSKFERYSSCGPRGRSRYCPKNRRFGRNSKRCATSISLCSGKSRTRYHDFSDLDSRFHRLINSATPNRFLESFYDIMTMIFHYHYQWNKRDERQRNEIAIGEHLTYIDALLGRNVAMVELACRAHLASAKETLIRSTSRFDPAPAKRPRRATSDESRRREPRSKRGKA